MLIRNVILHQFHEVNEAKDFMEQFMRTWASMVQVNAESQDSINLGVDDLIRLPEFTSVCQWLVNGAVQPAFYAKDINWEPYFRQEWLNRHMAEQEVLAQEGPVETAEVREVLHPQPTRDPSPLPVIPNGVYLEMDDPFAEAERGALSEAKGATRSTPPASVEASGGEPEAAGAVSQGEAAAAAQAPAEAVGNGGSKPVTAKAERPSRATGAKNGKGGGVPFTLPSDWHEDDPRVAFCAEFKVEPARLLQTAAELGATDEEVRFCCNWLVKHKGGGGGSGLARLSGLLRVRSENRLLEPLAKHWCVPVKDLRENILARGLTVRQICQAYARTPNATKIEDLIQTGT